MPECPRLKAYRGHSGMTDLKHVFKKVSGNKNCDLSKDITSDAAFQKSFKHYWNDNRISIIRHFQTAIKSGIAEQFVYNQ